MVTISKLDAALLPYAFCLLLALPFFLLLRQGVYSYIKLKNQELKLIAIGSSVDQRIQAYERMTLLLERIKPSNLVQRFASDLEIHEFVFLTEKMIQEEFDYNGSQQLYISKNAWENIVTSKNNILGLLRTTFSNLKGNADLQNYKTLLLMNYINGEDFIALTIEELKKEALLLQ